MDLATRAMRESDREGFYHVRSRVYRGGAPVHPHENLLPCNAMATVTEKDGQIVAAATGLRFQTVFHQSTVNCAGVAAVGVLPEHRRGGVGSALMRGANRQYREEGFALAALLPYRHPFYRAVGYETCGMRYKISAPGHRLASFHCTLPIRELLPNQFSEILACYESFARQRNAMNLRSHEQWQNLLSGDLPFTIYAAGDPVEAYALVKLNPDFWSTQSIRELVWSSAEGYQSIQAHLRALAMNKTTMEWWEPGDSPYLAAYCDQGVTFASDGLFMFSALNVPELLSKLPVGEEATIRIQVEDPILPENCGPWRVTRTPQGIDVSACSDFDLSVSLQRMTQMLMGEPSATDLIRANLIIPPSEKIRAALESIFPARRVYCVDLY